MSAINGPGGLYQSQWEHAQVTTASCHLTDAKGWLNKDEFEPTKRALAAKNLINIASDTLRNIARLNSSWRQNDFYSECEKIAQRLSQDVARILDSKQTHVGA